MLPLMKIHWQVWTISPKFSSMKFTCAAKQLAPHISYDIWILESESKAKKKKGRGALIVNVHGKQPYIVRENYFPIGNMYMGACAWTCMHTCPHVHTHPRAHIDVYLKMHKIYCIFDLSPQKEYTKGFFPLLPTWFKILKRHHGAGRKAKHKMKDSISLMVADPSHCSLNGQITTCSFPLDFWICLCLRPPPPENNSE